MITNNVIYDSYLYGLNLAGYPFGAFPRPNSNFSGFQGYIANNTIAYTNTRAGICVWQANSNVASEMLGTRIENNILYENSLACADCGSGIDFVSTGAIGTVVKNNVFYATGAGGTIFISGGSAGSTYIASGNSTATKPNMANAPATLPASPDFSLLGGSMGIDYGIDLSSIGVPTDYKGSSRPKGWPLMLARMNFQAIPQARIPLRVCRCANQNGCLEMCARRV